ncbi:cryptochrome/photolyase family protein [Methylovulum psychrotolerans]|uniref:Deoxyribodipyrimidine photo-lyase n=1 Tax=Methylovulum psychrotolerans TaxID=1704499 RepID=A0A2S5CRU0_9GAMM|nr:deoxyribodipyrimidine photo-lyase [Methylovulum psychrotolerans]POZ53539.1 deoxyribodipyrimidine photo-lyase [Methylovulum psychrotolerans]
MPHYNTALFLFRRDLRLSDNTALNAALQSAQQVIAGFVFDERQINPHPYQSQPALQFMRQSLADLAGQLQAVNANLALFQGLPVQVIRDLHQQHTIQAVFINRDYSPFSRQRDAEIADVCRQLNIALHSLPDALLTEPEQALKHDGSAYKVFTAFYHHVQKRPVPAPQALVNGRFLSVASTAPPDSLTAVGNWGGQGGRTAGLARLAQLQHCTDYALERDFPALAATSQLSAHLKFGTLSVREAFAAITRQLGAEHPLLRQLYWRDFMTHIAYHYPTVFGHAFIGKFDGLVWDNNRAYFQAWAEGRTGFPIVDAGMRELNATGFMHNRVRMITASFLVKDLRISWRWGERYFAQHLTDYDPCVNNGNWQWAASTGCDAQPYFRIFNPWLQQQKFDPQGDYLYRWLPELRSVPIKTLHQWPQKHYGDFYPAPIIDHSTEVQITKARFKAAG